MTWRLKLLCLLFPLMTSCGQTTDSYRNNLKIYGGSEVNGEDKVAKFTVSLLASDRAMCTGVLIDRRLVLTAAHCYSLMSTGEVPYVGFGLKAKDSKKVRIANFIPHPNFDRAAGQIGGTEKPVNDIGLILLADDAPEGYEPISLMNRGDRMQNGESVLLAGFGNTDKYNGIFWRVTGELYQVETKLILESSSSKEVWFGATPGKSACNGDSGGPAVVFRGSELKLLGVTSRGKDCRSEVIYTDIRYFGFWIDETSQRMSSR